MLHISNKSLNPSSLITPLSFGEGVGGEAFSLFWRGVGGEAVCFIWFMFIIASSQVHRTIRVDLRYLCSLIIKQLSRVRLLLRALGAIRVRNTPAAQPTGLFV